MRDDYKNQMASKIAGRYQDLELRIMKDIVRRIKKTGKITSTADWQINRLLILGYSSEDIEKEIKKTLDASYPEMFEFYDTMQKSLEQNISKLSGMPEHVQLIPCGREEFGRKNSCIRYVVLEQ